MKGESMKNKTKKHLLAATSLASGALNATIGAGGGILLTLALGRLCRDSFDDRRDIYVNSQAAMIPGCALSCIIYAHRGTFSLISAIPLAISAAIGGILGSLLLKRISSRFIGKLFAILVIWSGMRMIMG